MSAPIAVPATGCRLPVCGDTARIKQESTHLRKRISPASFTRTTRRSRNALFFGDLRSRNKEHEPLLLFKKSQKLLDRLLFIFFGEDKGLLPPNLVKKTIEDWDRLRELDEPRPLYDLFKRYFKYINEGTDRKDLNIFAYNGGLFEADRCWTT
ncbi:MAG: hypothetical protein IPM82_18990 [Saprospiraceae bacterium]|nr:hypothetical protein [Saprospiraceae bacterium]